LDPLWGQREEEFHIGCRGVGLTARLVSFHTRGAPDSQDVPV
jgi:hypothetical protein